MLSPVIRCSVTRLHSLELGCIQLLGSYCTAISSCHVAKLQRTSTYCFLTYQFKCIILLWYILLNSQNPGIKNQTTLGFPNYSSKVTSPKNMNVGSWVRIANWIFQHPKHLFSWKWQVTCTWYTLPIFISTLKAVILSPLLWRTIRNRSQIKIKSAESRKVISCKA